MTDNFKGLAKDSIYKQSPFQRALGRMVTIHNSVPQDIPVGEAEADLAADAFWSYFADSPRKDPVSAGRDLNARLIDWATGSSSWEGSKAKTAGRLLTSAAAAGILHSQLISDPEIKKLMDEQKEAEEAQRQAEDAQQTLDMMNQLGIDEPQQKAQLAAQVAKAQAKAQAAAQAIEAGMEQLTNSPVGQAKRASAVRQAREEAEKAEAFVTSWGKEPGSIQASDLASVQNMIQKYGATLDQITRLMGRVEGIALSQQTKKVKKANVVVSDGYTQSLPHIFPGELSLLNPAVPGVIRASKMGEYADHGLIGMVEGTDAKIEGGIVFLVDGSGSMAGHGRNTKATALALGMGMAAHKNGQPYKMIRFGSWQDPLYTVTSDQDMTEQMAWAGTFQNGGTDFNKPLNEAMDYIATLGERADQTDIVMITDGEAGIERSTLARFREFADLHKTRLIYLAVGEDDSADNLIQLASQRVFLGDGMGVEKTAEVLAGFLWQEEGKR